MERIGLIIVLLGLAAVFFFFRSSSRDRVSGPQARDLVGQGALLVDVRTKSEFTSGHLPGAINIPVQELSARIGELGARDRPLVVYCQSGMRSARAVRGLKQAGFEKLYDLGPMSAW